MTILFSLFFISLAGLLGMFSLKLYALRSQGGGMAPKENVELLTPYLLELKLLGQRKIKRYGYITLVSAIRMYFRSSNIVKSNYQDLKNRMKDIKKRVPLSETEEVNKFLEAIADYKHKIKEIKHKIKEEEKAR